MYDTFKSRVKLLDKFNIKYSRAYEYRGPVGPERKQHDLELFESIFIPFTPSEWCRLCMREGDLYIGGCCGNTSRLQDYLNGWFRDGGWIQVKELARFSGAVFSHEGFENWDDNVSLASAYKTVSKNWAKADPLDKLAFIWKTVKDHYSPERPIITHEKRRNDPYTYMSDLVRGLESLSWSRLFSDDKDNSDQKKSNTLIKLSRVIPPLKLLSDNIQSLNVGPIVGFAIVSKVSPEVVATNSLGYCIYGTVDEVRNIFSLWDKSDEQFKESNKVPARTEYSVRKVKVSCESGIELGDFIEV